MKIYTKTGDKGFTSLVSGAKVSKADTRIDLYGDLDELNSHIGLTSSLLHKETIVEMSPLLYQIQCNLFNLGGRLACESALWSKLKLPPLDGELTTALEMAIDKMEKSLTPLKNFVLPGGGVLSSEAHICRTICRRVERKLIQFEQHSPTEVPEGAKEFLNRLSDYFFVLARYLNFLQSEEEVLWMGKKGSNS